MSLSVHPHWVSSSPVERRAASRFRLSRSARLLDVSAIGLSLETSASLEKDEAYDLVLHVDDRHMPVSGRVLRLTAGPETVSAAMVFERILEPDRQFLKHSLARDVAERMTVVLR